MDAIERGGSAYSLRDLLLAALITFCGVAYWTWNERPAAEQHVPAATAVPAQNSPAQGSAGEAFTQLTNEGLRLYKNQDYQGAEKYFRIALEASPNSALAYNNLGAALNAERKYRESVPILERAVALDPALELARNNLALAYRETGKIGK